MSSSERPSLCGTPLIGPKHLTSDSKAVWNTETNQYEGGIALERNSRAKNIGSSPRAYSLGHSYEPQTYVEAPTASNKVKDGVKPDDALVLRKRVARVCILII